MVQQAVAISTRIEFSDGTKLNRAPMITFPSAEVFSDQDLIQRVEDTVSFLFVANAACREDFPKIETVTFAGTYRKQGSGEMRIVGGVVHSHNLEHFKWDQLQVTSVPTEGAF